MTRAKAGINDKFMENAEIKCTGMTSLLHVKGSRSAMPRTGFFLFACTDKTFLQSSFYVRKCMRLTFPSSKPSGKIMLNVFPLQICI